MRGALCLAAVLLFAAACTKFGAEDGPDAGPDASTQPDGGRDGAAPPVACTDGCNPAATTCRQYDFAGACPSDLVRNIPEGNPLSRIECLGDALNIFTRETQDATASITLTSPSGANLKGHAAVTATLKDWINQDGNALPVLELTSGGRGLATLQAATTSGKVRYTLCLGAGAMLGTCGSAFEVPTGMPHRVALDLDGKEMVTLSIDCKVTAMLPNAAQIAPKSGFKLRLGSNDGSPIDGSFDDVVLSVTP